MKRITIILTLLVGLLLGLVSCSNGIGEENLTESDQITENESSNNNSSENATIERETAGQIISTTIALTEIMDALELELVGVPTSYKELPERYQGLPEVGMAAQPDMEIIKSLQPTD